MPLLKPSKASSETYRLCLRLRFLCVNLFTGGAIDAGVIEYQSYVNAKLSRDGEPEVRMSDVFEFIPFGIRHDNPMAYINNPNIPNADNLLYKEGLENFADFIASNRGAVRQAQEYGFLEMPLTSRLTNPDGAGLVTAQQVWKDNKAGGVPVVATFVADVSGSMNNDGKMQALRDALVAASGFIRPDMNVGLIEYASEIIERVPIAPFTDQARARFVQASQSLSENGGTPLYEAAMVGMLRVEQKAAEIEAATGEPVKKMVFVLTDGDPRGIAQDSAFVDAMLLHSRQLGIQLHGIAFGGNAKMSVMREIGTFTDGAVIQIKNTQDLRAQMAKLFNSQL